MLLSKCEVCDVKNPNLCITAWRFTYGACGLCTKKKKKKKIFKRQEMRDILWYIYQNKLDEAFDIAKNPIYDGYQSELASLVFNFLIKDLLCLHGWRL